MTSSHPGWSLISLRDQPRLLLLRNNMLLLLDQSAAVAESGEQAVGNGVAFDIVGLADFTTFQECEAGRMLARSSCSETEGRENTYSHERWQQFAPTQRRQSLLMRS